MNPTRTEEDYKREQEEKNNKIVNDMANKLMINIQLRMLNVDKLSDDLQYKMESTVNEMIINLIDYDMDLDDDDENKIDYKSNSSIIYQFNKVYDSDNSEIIRDYYIETLFNPVVDQVELVKYAKSYMIEVIGMPLECYDESCNLNFYKNEEDRVYHRVLVGIQTFIKMNEPFIIDSFHAALNDNNVILK